jgi:hypothetical protein
MVVDSKLDFCRRSLSAPDYLFCFPCQASKLAEIFARVRPRLGPALQCLRLAALGWAAGPGASRIYCLRPRPHRHHPTPTPFCPPHPHHCHDEAVGPPPASTAGAQIPGPHTGPPCECPLQLEHPGPPTSGRAAQRSCMLPSSHTFGHSR